MNGSRISFSLTHSLSASLPVSFFRHLFVSAAAIKQRNTKNCRVRNKSIDKTIFSFRHRDFIHVCLRRSINWSIYSSLRFHKIAHTAQTCMHARLTYGNVIFVQEITLHDFCFTFFFCIFLLHHRVKLKVARWLAEWMAGWIDESVKNVGNSDTLHWKSLSTAELNLFHVEQIELNTQSFDWISFTWSIQFSHST